MLRRSAEPLVAAYDLAMLDLDGVVYVGGHAVDGVADRLAEVREAGMHVAFITNNASRTTVAVAEVLNSLGVPADADDVVTSAQAAARLLIDRFGAGARIALLGAAGLRDALEDQDLRPVAVDDAEAVALVTGYGPDVVWRDIMRAAVRVRDGLPWVASNTDLTIPTDFGTAPGHGVLVDLLRRFTGVTPVVAGKPQRPLLDETVRRVGGERPLMVGDRLDTDIEGAHHAGIDSLLVLTGVSGLPDLAGAERRLRPTYLSPGLEGLLTAHPVPDRDGDRCALGGWRAGVADGRLEVDGEGSAADWWRTVVTAAWTHLDECGTVADIGDLRAPMPGAGADAG